MCLVSHISICKRSASENGPTSARNLHHPTTTKNQQPPQLFVDVHSKYCFQLDGKKPAFDKSDLLTVCSFSVVFTQTREYWDKCSQFAQQKGVVAAAKRLVDMLANIGNSFRLDSITIFGSLKASAGSGQFGIKVAGRFFGVDCCPPLSIGFNTDVVSVAKIWFDRV